MKLWDKGGATAKMVEEFTVGKDRELDVFLAPYDVLGNMAQAHMLEAVQLISTVENEVLQAKLKELLVEVQADNFTIPRAFEDIHSWVEHELTVRCGEAGKKVHTGRSRNDQVLLDVQLFIRAELFEVVQLLEKLFHAFQALSEQHASKMLPGYTHLQVAMPSSFGLWFGAYAENFVDDLRSLLMAYELADQNPLGSGAGFGSSFPLDRKLTAQLMGFRELRFNAAGAQLQRGKLEMMVSQALASLAYSLGQFAMDTCLYAGQNFGFIQIADAYTTGSSIMPHKKNPDVLELIRAKCSQLQSLPQQMLLLTHHLPSGYHRDFQLLKEQFIPAFGALKNCLQMLLEVLPHLEIVGQSLADEKYRYLTTVEAVNEFVQQGVPFREAYQRVGSEVEGGAFRARTKLEHSHVGSMGNLCTASIAEKWEKVRTSVDLEQGKKALERLAKGALRNV